MNIYNLIQQRKQAGKRMLVCLLDPEKTTLDNLPDVCKRIINSDIDFLFVGGSGYTGNLDEYIRCAKQSTKPVVIFPGALTQISKEADALLFLSLLSGKNADWMIHNQAKTVVAIREMGIETIGLGYIVVNTGSETSVERVTGEKGLPEANVDTIVHTAMAAEMMGFPMVYLEAGSGAKSPMKAEIIAAVRANIRVPLVVGGGICTQAQLTATYEAGADIVVIGNHFEQHPEDITTFQKCTSLK